MPQPPESAAWLSIVMPVLNEAATVTDTLQAMQALRAGGVEVVVADGGSTDGTAEQCQPWVDRVIAAPRGRARQMNAGAAAARGAVLLFLHADTRLPEGALQAVQAALRRPVGPAATAPGPRWGRFDVHIQGRSRWLPMVAWFMNGRSRLTGICTGDQTLFVERPLFEALGGFPDQPLMEDVEISRRLLRHGPPACLRLRVATSGRRWDRDGAWRTIRLMWRLRWLYWRGVSPDRLAALYR